MAQLAFGLGGGAIGSMFGMPQMGFMVGSMLGGLFANKNKEKPKIGDLRVAASTYGIGIPKVWGTQRVSGNLIWAPDIWWRKRKKKKGESLTGGKGGKATGEYDYFADFAYAICEGPAVDILRVWMDAELIYDKLGKGQYYAPGTRPAPMTKEEYKKKMKSLSDPNIKPRIYMGTDSQLPDPYMNAKLAGLSPGYRNVVYLTWSACPLELFGDRVPSVSVEIVTKANSASRWDIIPMKWLPTDEHVINGGENNFPFVDNDRRRLMTSGPTGWHVWDLNAMQENFEKFYTVANVAGDARAGQLDKQVGMDPDGYPICLWGLDNCEPIGILDPETFAAADRWGHSTIWAGNEVQGSRGVEDKVSKVARSVSQKAENDNNLTFVTTQFNSFMVFGTKNGNIEPLWEGRDFYGTGSLDFMVPGADSFVWAGVTNSQLDVYKIFVPASSTLYNPPATDGSATIQFSVSAATYQCDRITVLQMHYDVLTDSMLIICDCSGGHMGRTVAGVFRGDDGTVRWMGPVQFSPWQPRTTNGVAKWFSGNRFATNVNSFNFITLEYETEPRPSDSYPLLNGPQFYFSEIDAHLWWGYCPDDTYVVDGHVENWFMTYTGMRDQAGIYLSDIVLDICMQVGIPRNRINVQELTTTLVRGYVVDNPVSARTAIEELSKAFMFDAVETDNVLTFKMRGHSPIVTIPEDNVAVVQEQQNDWYIETRQQEVDLPMRIVVTYDEVKMDYENNTQFWKRVAGPRPTMQSTQSEDFTIALAMEAGEAKQLAQKMLSSAWHERVQHEWKLPWQYIVYDPTDVITFQGNDGLTFNERLLKADIGADMSIKVQTLSQDPASYVSTLEGSISDYQPPITGLLPDPAKALVINTPLLVDSDDLNGTGSRYYLAAGALVSTFSGANLAISLNGGIDWQFIPGGFAENQTTYGTVATVVPPPVGGAGATDTLTEITIEIAQKGPTWTVSNVSEEELLDGTVNAVLIGDEIIQFRDVGLSADGKRLTISHLLRGRRGTEWACHTHKKFDTVVFLDETLLDAQVTTDFINRSLKWKAVGIGLTVSASPTTTGTVKGYDLMPYAPQAFKRADHANGDVELSWSRRTRIAGGMKDGIGDVPMIEGVEKYNVYVLDAPFDPNASFDPTNSSNYVRKFEGLTNPTVTYTSAMQLDDGYDVTKPVYLVAFQLSTYVGPGFPGWAALWKYKVT